MSSPGDVLPERQVVRAAVEALRDELRDQLELDAFFWEQEALPSTTDYTSSIESPAHFDLVIVLLWSRLGTPLDPELHPRPDGGGYASGTEYEIEVASAAHAEHGRPDVYIFRKAQSRSITLDDFENRAAFDQKRALDEYLDRFQRRGEYYARAVNDFADRGELADKVVQVLKRGASRALGEAPRQEATWTEGSPFRGLEAFDRSHARVFFGRDREALELEELVEARRTEGESFVLIFGASGVGKSSLARARLLPRLERLQTFPDRTAVRTAVVRPSVGGSDATAALVNALLQPDVLPELASPGETVEAMAFVWREAAAAAAASVKTALAAAARAEGLEAVRLVVLLDQLEEVFVAPSTHAESNQDFRGDPVLRSAFFDVVAALARSGVVDVVATLRSDFFDACEPLPTLMDLKKQGSYHLKPPGREALAEMVRRPARAAGLHYEVRTLDAADPTASGALDDRLIEEAAHQPNALPLLQFALFALYAQRSETGQLTFAAYEALGGLPGAIGRRAEDAFSALSRQARAALEPLLPLLVSVATDGRTVRQTPRRTDLEAAHPGAETLLAALVDTHRLLVSDAVPVARDPERPEGVARSEAVVTVAHEALLGAWPRLAAWVDANREALTLRTRLRASRAAYEVARDASYLWSRGRSVEEAKALATEHRHLLNDVDRDFADRSVRAGRRTRWTARAVVTSVIVGLSALSVAALSGMRRAEVSAARSEAQVLFSAARESPDLERLYPLEATARAGKAAADLPWVSYSSLAGIDERAEGRQLLAHTGPVYHAAFSPDGERLVTASVDNTARLWDLDAGRMACRLCASVWLDPSSLDGERFPELVAIQRAAAPGQSFCEALEAAGAFDFTGVGRHLERHSLDIVASMLTRWLPP